MKKKSFAPRRNIVSFELDETGIMLLDAIRAWLQQTSYDNTAVTRSAVMREAIQCLYDRITSDNRINPKVTPT